MKKLLLSAVGLVTLGLAGSAAAADLAARPYTKAPPMMAAAMYDWSGFYIGANGGWGTSHNCSDSVLGTLTFSDGCHDATGGVAGGQVGYRWQTGAFVFGLEAQGDWANLRGSNVAAPNFPGFANNSKIDAFGLFTGQVGYAWNNALLYAKGGAAVVDDRFDVTSVIGNTLAGVSGTQTRWGATAGAGVEVGFAPNWSAAVEYDHVFRQETRTDFTSPPAGGAFFGTKNIRQDVNMVTARVNYRWGGAPVARY
jgi:outer membrane immunogenic protein